MKLKLTTEPIINDPETNERYIMVMSRLHSLGAKPVSVRDRYVIVEVEAQVPEEIKEFIINTPDEQLQLEAEIHSKVQLSTLYGMPDDCRFLKDDGGTRRRFKKMHGGIS